MDCFDFSVYTLVIAVIFVFIKEMVFFKPKFKAGDILVDKDSEEWDNLKRPTITIIKVGKYKYLYIYNNDPKMTPTDLPFDWIETVYRKIN
jgi:hypothetical protein